DVLEEELARRDVEERAHDELVTVDRDFVVELGIAALDAPIIFRPLVLRGDALDREILRDRAEGEHLKARELDVRYGDAGLDRRVDDDVERFRAPVHLDETRSFALAEAKRQNARGVLPLGAERAPSVLLRRLLERSPPRIERDEERHPRERGE